MTRGGACPKQCRQRLQDIFPMSNPDDLTPDPSRQSATPIRDAALRGAVVTCFVLVVVALVRGYGDAWLLFWAMVAILAGFLVAGPKRSLGLRSSWWTSDQW